MGGDHAPEEIVAGALLAAAEFDLEIILVGDEARVRPLMLGKVPDRVTLRHAPEAIAMDLAPSAAVRTCERTSLGIAVDLVKRGEADAVISAGNSGAFLAVAMIKLRPIEGVSRPAIATVWPALNGPTVLLDSGANVDCRPEWLEQFAIMGSAYAKCVLGVREPRVGVLSVGEERSKGNQLALEAARLGLTHAFTAMGLERVEADIDPANQPSRRLAERLGFRQEGLLRHRWKVDGVWSDSVWYGLLREELSGA